jgi:Phosphotransferase enzyme family
VTALAAFAPGLDDLLDAESMTPRLRDALGAGPEANVVSIRPIVWKPGSRALVAYTLDGPAGHRLIYGKHFAKPQRGSRLYHTWVALQGIDFGPAAGVPTVSAWIPDLSMVLYVPASGRPLDAAVRVQGADAPMRAVGAWLARLHASALRPERRFDLAQEIVNLGRWAERVATVVPPHAAAARRLLRDLEGFAERMRPSARVPVPIHKDFHYRHVVIGGRMVALDFDEVRLGDASFDLAHFCVYLVLLGARDRHARALLPELERGFLGSYIEHTGWTPDERFVFYSGYTCLKIAKQLAQMTGVEPRPGGRERDRQLRLILEHGRALCRGGL